MEAPSVKAGGYLKTPLGELEIIAVRPITLDQMSEEQASAAGYASLAQACDALSDNEEQLNWIEFAFAGPDPRVELSDVEVWRYEILQV